MKTFLIASFVAALLPITLVFAAIENHFLRLQGFLDECPPTETLPIGSRRVFENKRQQTIQFFGIDPFDGPIATTKVFGPPLQTRVLPKYPGLERIRGCSCIYDGLRLAFFDSVLGLIELTGRRWSFPIGIRIGDTEQHVLELLGDPKSRLPFGIGQVQLTYQPSGVLTIETTRGRVSKIVWY
jgi:hypothetical protein